MTGVRWRIFYVAALIVSTAFPLSWAAGAGPATARAEHESPLYYPAGREVLVRYAKGVFLARLGYGPRPELPSTLAVSPRACFVTFFVGRRVVACFGGFQPRTVSLAEEIEENIRLAFRYDPRAAAIDRRTALAARVQLTFPDAPEPVSAPELINPAREGLFVENNRRGVAIVPGEAKTAAWGYRSAMERLGERDPLRVCLYRFRAVVVR